MSSEEMTQKEVEFKVEETKLQLQSDILATKQSIAKIESELELIKHTYPLNPKEIVNLQVELESYKDGLTRLEALMTELF